MEQIFGSNPFDIVPHLTALLIAYALAIPIGWNREHQERSAGLRTFPLVAVASCGFIQSAEHLTTDSPEAMARIVEGLITGMGFIGGGAILRLKDSVKGTATAASLGLTGRWIARQATTKHTTAPIWWSGLSNWCAVPATKTPPASAMAIATPKTIPPL